MPTVKAGTLSFEVTAEGVAQVQQRVSKLGEKLSKALNPKNTSGFAQALRKQTAAANEDLAAIKKLSNEAATLRSQWQTTGTGAAELTAKLKQVRQAALDMGKGFEIGSQEMRAASLVAAQTTRTITGIEGGVTRLGVAEQTASALTQTLRGSLLILPGPLGQVGYGLTVAESGLANLAERVGLSTGGMLALAGGIGAIAVSAGALEARGLGQVKDFTQAVNILTASGADISNLDAQLRRVQESAGLAGQAFSRAELAGSLADTVKAGLDASDALKLLGASIDLASADGQDLNDSTALLLQNLRQFGLGSDSARQAADELAAAGLDAAGSAADLSTGLATVGPVAQQAGLNMAQTLGILVNLDNKGLSAATVGAKGFRTVLTSLADPSAKARQAIKDLGVSLEDAEGHARPVKDVLFDIKDALEKSGVSFDATTGKIKGNSDALRTAAEIFRTRGVTSILALDDSLKTYTTDIENSTGKSKAFADQMQQGLPAAEQRFSKSLDDLSKDLASLTVGPLTDFINALDSVIDKWDTLLNGPGQAVRLQGQNRLESFIKQFGAQYGQPLANLLDQIDQASAKLGQAEKTLASDKGFLGKIVGVTPAGHSIFEQDKKAVADLKKQLQDLQNQYQKVAQAAVAAEKSSYAQLPLLPSAASGAAGATGSFEQAIQQAKALEAALKAAHNPQAYDKAAQALRDFTDAEIQGKNQATLNARALADVRATLDSVTSSAKSAGSHLKTVAELFSNLAAKGADAQQKAAALGKGLQDQLQSVQTREQLVGGLIDTLLSAPYNLSPDSNKIEYLVGRLKDLQALAKELQKEIGGLGKVSVPSLGSAELQRHNAIHATLSATGPLTSEEQNALWKAWGLSGFSGDVRKAILGASAKALQQGISADFANALYKASNALRQAAEAGFLNSAGNIWDWRAVSRAAVVDHLNLRQAAEDGFINLPAEADWAAARRVAETDHLNLRQASEAGFLNPTGSPYDWQKARRAASADRLNERAAAESGFLEPVGTAEDWEKVRKAATLDHLSLRQASEAGFLNQSGNIWDWRAVADAAAVDRLNERQAAANGFTGLPGSEKDWKGVRQAATLDLLNLRQSAEDGFVNPTGNIWDWRAIAQAAQLDHLNLRRAAEMGFLGSEATPEDWQEAARKAQKDAENLHQAAMDGFTGPPNTFWSWVAARRATTADHLNLLQAAMDGFLRPAATEEDWQAARKLAATDHLNLRQASEDGFLNPAGNIWDWRAVRAASVQHAMALHQAAEAGFTGLPATTQDWQNLRGTPEQWRKDMEANAAAFERASRAAGALKDVMSALPKPVETSSQHFEDLRQELYAAFNAGTIHTVDRLLELLKEVNKAEAESKTATTLNDVAQALDAIGGAIGGLPGQFAQLGSALIKDFGSGDVLGGVLAIATATIGELGDINQKIQQRTAEMNKLHSAGVGTWKDIAHAEELATFGTTKYLDALKEAAGIVQNNPLIGPDVAKSLIKYQQTLEGGFLGLFPHFVKTIDDAATQAAVSIYDTLANAISSAVTQGIVDGFNQGDFSKVSKNLKKGLDDTVVKEVVKEMLDQAFVKGALGKDMAAIDADIQASNWSKLNADVQKAYADAQVVLAHVEGSVSGLPGFGQFASSGTSTASTFALPEATFKPAFDFSALPANLPNLISASASIPVFSNAVDKFERAADLFANHAVGKFDAVVDRLANEGITINTQNSQTSGGGLTASDIRKAGS